MFNPVLTVFSGYREVERAVAIHPRVAGSILGSRCPDTLGATVGVTNMCVNVKVFLVILSEWRPLFKNKQKFPFFHQKCEKEKPKL